MNCAELKTKILEKEKYYEENYQRVFKKINKQGFINRIEWDFGELYKYDFLKNEFSKYLEAIKDFETEGKMEGNQVLDFWIERLQNTIIGNELFSPTYSNNSSGIISGPIIALQLDSKIELLKFFKILKKFGI